MAPDGELMGNFRQHNQNALSNFNGQLQTGAGRLGWGHDLSHDTTNQLAGAGFGPNSYWNRRGEIAGEFARRPGHTYSAGFSDPVNGIYKDQRAQRQSNQAGQADAQHQGLLAMQQALAGGLPGGIQAGAASGAYNNSISQYGQQQAQINQQRQQQHMQSIGALMSLLALLG